MQGHFQVVLSRAHCPLLQRNLRWFDRILYCSGVFSYVVGAITTPTFILIPILTVWVGIFPIVVSEWAAVGLTVRPLQGWPGHRTLVPSRRGSPSSSLLRLCMILPSGK